LVLGLGLNLLLLLLLLLLNLMMIHVISRPKESNWNGDFVLTCKQVPVAHIGRVLCLNRHFEPPNKRWGDRKPQRFEPETILIAQITEILDVLRIT
jgi:hypothetical protein